MLPWMTCITSTVSPTTRCCEFIELQFTCHTFLRGTDHCTGRPELSRAGNSSGMLSPSADQYSGRTAVCDCAAWSRAMSCYFNHWGHLTVDDSDKSPKLKTAVHVACLLTFIG